MDAGEGVKLAVVQHFAGSQCKTSSPWNGKFLQDDHGCGYSSVSVMESRNASFFFFSFSVLIDLTHYWMRRRLHGNALSCHMQLTVWAKATSEPVECLSYSDKLSSITMQYYNIEVDQTMVAHLLLLKACTWNPLLHFCVISKNHTKATKALPLSRGIIQLLFMSVRRVQYSICLL